MLSLPSINTTSPSVLVSRPALVSDAVRSVNPMQVIEPTTAISRERSRVDSKLDQQVSESGQAAQAEQVTQAADVARQLAQARQRQTTQQGGDQPPSEKSVIQKAMDVQIKDLLSNVWKASGKAVDFLLGRSETLMDQALKKVQLPEEVDYLKGASSSGAEGGGTPSTDVAVQAYTASGSALGTEPRGQLLDMVA